MRKMKVSLATAFALISLLSAALSKYLTLHSPLQCLSLFSLDSLSNTDLTSRLAQTNERMKKLSATFDEWPEEEEVVVSARNSASDQTLVRTTRIRVVDPLDGMIESMIQKPDEPPSSPESYPTPVVSEPP